MHLRISGLGECRICTDQSLRLPASPPQPQSSRWAYRRHRSFRLIPSPRCIRHRRRFGFVTFQQGGFGSLPCRKVTEGLAYYTRNMSWDGVFLCANIVENGWRLSRPIPHPLRGSPLSTRGPFGSLPCRKGGGFEQSEKTEGLASTYG